MIAYNNVSLTFNSKGNTLNFAFYDGVELFEHPDTSFVVATWRIVLNRKSDWKVNVRVSLAQDSELPEWRFSEIQPESKEYIIQIRMERAKELIGSTRQSFTDIAEQTGFSTQRYFSTAFRQYTGQTPTQYRNNCRK